MKSIDTNILIHSTPDIVWGVLMDFNSYPEWNPFITSIEGEARKGATLKNTIRVNDKSAQVFKPTILELKPKKEFRWLGHLFVRGLFDGEHYFLIEQVGKTSVRLTHGEKFSGLLAGTLMKIIGENTKNGFEAMNKALKKRVEAINN
ncbi:SRPBCC domain-containing protein [Fulvivirgaceae bacterium BMA10]|uniref:SRPBCC domain-containing protein n=1 Tax=Splendidivirga corallicola TaxID=3051826 RepID=A0ABT8KX75_9BACT|nr:SRPBCC domain-containing protein [Fulvivirgaceae bacterium BMA10]